MKKIVFFIILSLNFSCNNFNKQESKEKFQMEWFLLMEVSF